ncbi:RcpC/CpaB family pilus assembly protein [Arthrobacter agilis]|uniref:RcpC/CpaB family pilus assembly protein n=1 Tax=Arthrobacter agilis TaxID=37921 RepID=UPI002789C527|nr:RcpC/CpaB family pilus assembly protein [Arthrobacter agilis]MDQ0735667.1 pilus assembly protein CpaB [Arthrobacter agilis]
MDPTTLLRERPFRYRLRRLVYRRRRLLACLLFSLAAGVAVEALVGDDYATTTVATAARDLAAGTVLTEADVALTRLPVAAVGHRPFGQTDRLVGQQLATPLLRGSPIASTALVGDGLLTGAAPGTVAVPLRPADPGIVQLLAPGQLVDVVLSTGNGFESPAQSTVLARAVAVLWTDAGGTGTWPGADGDGGLVVVAARAAEAAALAGSSSSGDVHLVLTAGR